MTDLECFRKERPSLNEPFWRRPSWNLLLSQSPNANQDCSVIRFALYLPAEFLRCIARAQTSDWNSQSVLGRSCKSIRTRSTASSDPEGRGFETRFVENRTSVVIPTHSRVDVVVITGDISSQALPEEYEIAKKSLDPLLNAFPTMILPGNHDWYTTQALDEKRMTKWFGSWMQTQPVEMSSLLPLDLRQHLVLFQYGPICLIGLDPCRPTKLGSVGLYNLDQLDTLAVLLNSGLLEATGLIPVVCTHYPVLTPEGRLYSDKHPMHGVENDGELVRVLSGVRYPPALVIHGHQHRGFRTQLRVPRNRRNANSDEVAYVVNESASNSDDITASIPIVCCGSSGYRYDPSSKRTASIVIHNFDVQGTNSNYQLQRYLLKDNAFVEEIEPFRSGF